MQFKPQPGPQTDYFINPADIVIYGGAAGGGKATVLDTVLPTPQGWVTMGEVRVGDQLFDESGNICSVLKVFDIIEAPELYRITFDDGSFIDACKDHLWHTLTAKDLEALTRRDDDFRARRRETRPSRAKGNKSEKFVSSLTLRNQTVLRPPIKPAPTGSIKTTLEIFNTLTIWKRNRKNHAVKISGSLNLPEIELPLDPYLLGLWLGDGTRGEGTITTSDEELTNGWRKRPSSKYCWFIPELKEKLKELGIIKNKHVPAIYLRASREQRLALLQGLMDTDGTVNKSSGSVEFDNTDEWLTDAVIELACSLGHKPGRKTKAQGKCNGKICKDVYSIKWTPPEYVFRLQRKKNIQKLSTRRTTQFRYIISVEPIKSSPARCISVSSNSGLFLAGERMIPTHNSFALLLDPLRRIHVPGFTSVIFRRTYPEFTNEGGLWDESENIYPFLGGVPKETNLSWEFPKFNNSIKFSHLEYEKDKLKYQGSQICFLGYDELTHFTKSQFFYLLSRNRSTCGIRPYIRATCNPDAESWVSEFIAYWIDQDTGYPIPERSGILRYFVRDRDAIIWADSEAELRELVPYIPEEDFLPKSVTFIPAKLSDNPALLQKDPGYKANLLALNYVDRERLLGGNWKIKFSAGTMFKTEWFKFLDLEDLPVKPHLMERVRAWDAAATEPEQKNKDPDYTAGVLMAEYQGRYYILDLVHFRRSPAQTVASLKSTAEMDGRDIDIYFEQEGGSAAKREIDSFKTGLFKGYNFQGKTVGKRDKVIRAKPFSAAVENGLVYIVRGPWNSQYVNELSQFPDTKFHDDIVDASSAGFEYLNRRGLRGKIDLSKMIKQRNAPVIPKRII